MGSAPSSDALSEKKVVIVGGCFGGVKVYLNLKGKCKLTVIDTRDYFHLTIATPRAVVEPAFTKRTLIPFKDLYGDDFKQGTVTKIDPSNNAVTLSDGETIPYDYLVIATGSSASFPGKVGDDTTTDQIYQMYKDAYEKVKAAQKITLIGGGAVGVELAGEIATDFPEKEVTLIHAKDTLVEPVLKATFRSAVKKNLEEMNVKLILGEKVENLADIPRDLSGGPRELKTDKGTTIQADLVFVCIGVTINKIAYFESLGQATDERGCLKVNTHLQVEGHQNIFAIGDCCNADLQKMAYRAGLQGESVAQNIPLAADGKAMKPYISPGVTYGISLGRDRGTFQLYGMVIGNWFTKRLKSKDLFTGRMWHEYGLEAPKL